MDVERARRPARLRAVRGTTDYWAADKQFMLNLRVRDLDGLLEELNASGVAVIVNGQSGHSPEAGRFARIHDHPEGKCIELREPTVG